MPTGDVLLGIVFNPVQYPTINVRSCRQRFKRAAYSVREITRPNLARPLAVPPILTFCCVFVKYNQLSIINKLIQMNIGRPTKYKPEFCEIALKILREGRSQAAVAAELNVAKSQITEWMKRYPDFQNACARGLAAAESVWEDPAFCPSLHPARWRLNMLNRFGWQDRQDRIHSGPNGGAIQTENRHIITTEPAVLKRMATEYLLGENSGDSDSDSAAAYSNDSG